MRQYRLLILVLGIAITCFLLAFAGGGERGEKRTAPLEWGLLTMRSHTDFKGRLKTNFARFATPPKYVMFFYPLGGDFPRPYIEAPADLGATTIVSLELYEWGPKKKPAYLPAINAGEYDESFRKWAEDAKEFGRRVLLRFGYEFNGNWFSWSLDPPAFVKAWRRAHDIFDRVGAHNVEWVWSPNFESCPNTPENDMHRYYPGDKYVDWVAVDGYNFGDHHDQWHKWMTFDEVFAKVLASFAVRYPDKPVMLAEFGCAVGKPGRRAQWIREAYKSLMRRPQVKTVIWFDLDKRRKGEPDWRIDATPDSLQAFNETFAAETP